MAVIFDVDGTLLDSVDLYARASQEALRTFVPCDAVRQQIGKGATSLLPVFLTKSEIREIRERLKGVPQAVFREKVFCRREAVPARA